MSGMVGRVAGAIREIRVGEHYCLAPDEAEEIARAAIEAMREPTAKMIASADAKAYGGIAPGEMQYHDAKHTWESMIDAALK